MINTQIDIAITLCPLSCPTFTLFVYGDLLNKCKLYLLGQYIGGKLYLSENKNTELYFIIQLRDSQGWFVDCSSVARYSAILQFDLQSIPKTQLEPQSSTNLHIHYVCSRFCFRIATLAYRFRLRFTSPFRFNADLALRRSYYIRPLSFPIISYST